MTVNPLGDALAEIADRIRALDADLRQHVCPQCGRPWAGVVPTGMTPEQAGLCVGHKRPTLPQIGGGLEEPGDPDKEAQQ